MTVTKRKAATTRKKGQAQFTDKQRTAIMSALASRTNLARKVAGVQYGGNRDIYQAAGYIAQGLVKFDHYWGLYTRGDVAGRIVDMPAKTTWRTPPMVTEPKAKEGQADEEGKTEFVRAFEQLAKRVRLWQYLTRADKLTGVGRYGVLFLGTRGSTDQMLKMPLDKMNKSEDLIYLSVYHEGNAIIKEWEMDPGSPRYGLPKLYELRVSSNQVGGTDGKRTMGSGTNLLVHASRVLHIAENLLEDDVYGTPRLERVINRLFDLDKIAASTGEAYWQSVARILQAKIDPEAEIGTADLEVLDEKLAEMVHDLRRQFYGQGVELSWLTNDTPDVHQVADFFFSLIAGATGIPKRILFGSEMGELASTTDQATWFGSINERQEQFAEPMLLRQFIDRMIALGALPMPVTKEYTVVWPTLYEDSDLQKADASLKRAQTAQALTPIGGNPRELVEIDEESNVRLIPRTADEVTDLETGDPDDDDLPTGDEDDDALGGDGEGGDGGVASPAEA